MYRLIDVYLADCRMYVYYCKAFQVSKINPAIIGYCSITDIVTVYVFCEKKSTMALFSHFHIIFDRSNIGFVILRMAHLEGKYASSYAYIINLMCIYIWPFHANTFLKNVFQEA